MDKTRVWDGNRPLSARNVVRRRKLAYPGINLTLATEDVENAVDWYVEESQETLVVHLDGVLDTMESVFSPGPSSHALPSVGDIWVIPAGCRYAARARGRQVSFAEFTVPSGTAEYSAPMARIGHRDPFLYQGALRAAALAERPDDLAKMALQSLMETLRWHIADVYLQLPLAPGPLNYHCFSEKQRARLLDHIDASMGKPLSIPDLMTVVQVPERQFMRAFKATFGCTPWQYVLKARLSRARHLLATTGASVTEISTETGFSSPSHFATAFGRHFGVTPSDYRREHLAEPV